MAVDGGLSCPICLRADEPDSMVHVTLEHSAVAPGSRAAICQECVTAIMQAAVEKAEKYAGLQAAVDAAGADEEQHDQPSTESPPDSVFASDEPKPVGRRRTRDSVRPE